MRVRELIFSIRSIIIEKIPTEEKRGWQEMKDVITVATMRESDAHTIALYVPSRELMYRAAMGVYQAVNWQGKKVAILTGSGNNGGDGYALAGILADHSVPCCLYQVSGRYSEDGKYYYDQAVEKGVERKQFSEGEDLSRYDILVDCLLGTGANQDFFLNCMGWTCEKEEGISIHAKTMTTEYLTMSASTASLLTLLVVAVLPAGYLAFGLRIWIRRKRQ